MAGVCSCFNVSLRRAVRACLEERPAGAGNTNFARQHGPGQEACPCDHERDTQRRTILQRGTCTLHSPSGERIIPSGIDEFSPGRSMPMVALIAGSGILSGRKRPTHTTAAGEPMNHDGSSETTSDRAPIDDPDRVAREWLANVYQGDTVRQLSVRSIVTGMLIGGVMSISNLYVGLKTGWGLTVTVTSCIIAYALFKFLEVIYPPWRDDPFTILENNTMSSAASAAGYMASAGLVSAIPALTLVTGRELGAWEGMAWLSAVSLLGVFMAIPLKRQLINVEQLPFPEGRATAQTLSSMHTAGTEAIHKARALVVAAVLAGLLEFCRSGFTELGKVWSQLEGWRKSVGDWLSRWALPEDLSLFLGLDRLFGWKTTVGSPPEEVLLGEGLLRKYTIG
ncbi:MAG: hypothetical protein EHM42_07435, partial [Planctomycetaceae bacterium]